jgi:UrcA family protein
MYNLKRAPLLAAGLLLAASQPVVAETADPTAAAATGTTVTVSLNRDQLHKLVSYGDLDLSSPQGMSTLNTRIRSAVYAVCPREDTRDLQRLNGVRQCRETATEGAMLQVQQLASLQKAPLSAALKP